MESIDEFLQRYEQHRWLYILTSPVVLLIGFVLLLIFVALAGAWLFVSECWREYRGYITSYPQRYRAAWRGRKRDGQA
ncbi:hypothetical protein [Eikenella exigua]|uniref:hypothetical protein n=1 Tax=Eikenella exigua TaxID=2528037 RepID=UPI00129A14AD|nr:hypothetical protein [Eikenella exigua]